MFRYRGVSPVRAKPPSAMVESVVLILRVPATQTLIDVPDSRVLTVIQLEALWEAETSWVCSPRQTLTSLMVVGASSMW